MTVPTLTGSSYTQDERVMAAMCSMIALPFSMVAAIPTTEGESTVSLLALLPIGVPFLMMGFSMFLWLLYMLYGLYGAASTLQGKDFRNVLIGNRLEKYLD
jgi:hypothetical protein